MSTPKRIIFADDDSKVRRLLEHALRAPEFEVRSAASGAEALAHLPDFRPDCVVTDMLMPDMDGEKLLRAMRALPGLETVPFLVVSAIRSEARIERVLEAGAAAFLLKPFPVRELIEKIRAVTADRVEDPGLTEAAPSEGPDEEEPPLADLLDEPPPPLRRQTEVGPSSTELGFGRFTKVEQGGRSFVVLTEIDLAPQFTVTTIITEKGIGRRKLQSSLLHPLTREEDRGRIRRQADEQHEDAIEHLEDVIREGGPRQVVWSDQSRSVDPGLLAWTVSALAQRGEAEGGVTETVRILRRSLEEAAQSDDALRVFSVTGLGRVIVAPGQRGRLPRRTVASVARWCVAFAVESLNAEEGDVLEPIREATRQRQRDLERVDFYSKLRRATH